ncbi:MAG: long-chain fatty acid--CoA ligase, partial [Alphaproteobacteria bacterium]|nr:long-chain fatty acid--CoA ligase [Alphaproteobacteria bacterium]
ASGGAPRPVEHVRRIAQDMPATHPVIGYGLTETNATGCGNFRENYINHPDSTGKVSQPLAELAIMDDAGNHLPLGHHGEIAFRTVCNFKYYWNRPEDTQAAFTADGFFRTGDIGYVDEEGYLTIVDRKKDIIIRGGENISSPEVEAACYEHPAVKECAVFGLPDPRYGEIPGAVVHVHEGEELTARVLCDFLKTRLAPFKIPAHIWFSEKQLPRLGTEKIDKRALREMYRKMPP